MSKGLEKVAFKMCRYILDQEFRNKVKSCLNAVTYIKEGDESNRSMISYYAKQHMIQGGQFKNYLVIGRDQHQYTAPIKFPTWDFSLTLEEAEYFSKGHNTLKYINSILISEIYKNFPNLNGLFDVYGNDTFNIDGYSDKIFEIDEKILEELRSTFMNSKTVQSIYNTDRKTVKGLHPYIIKQIIALEDKIASADISNGGPPKDITNLILEPMKGDPDGKIVKVILLIISIRAILKIINQIFFQAFHIDKMTVLNQDSIFEYTGRSNNLVCEYTKISYQISGDIRILHPTEIFLIIIETKSIKEAYLALARGMTVSIGGDHGDKIDLEVIALNSDLNPYKNLVR